MSEYGGSRESEANSSVSDSLDASRRSVLKTVSAIAGVSAAGGAAASASAQQGDDPNNIIIYVGDGQGASHISLARYLKAYQDDPEAFPLNVKDAAFNFDRFDNVGMTTTYPNDPEEVITDSAASGTGFSAGVKSYNGAVGGVVDDGEFQEVTTILEAVREQGYATGLVTTARMTHATPAVFASHVPDRDQEAEIARQYYADKNVDVLFGGGRQFFLPKGRDDGRDLTQEFQDDGYGYATTESELESLDSGPALGLFAPNSHMDYVLDRQDDDDSTQPSLPQMTEKAIELLRDISDGEGIFLMVEAARIDHASHANDFAVAYEQTEADDTVGVIHNSIEDLNNDTLFIGTADHECGGLSLGYNGPYDVNYQRLDGVSASGSAMADAIGETGGEFGDEGTAEIATIFEELGGFEPTKSEVDAAVGYVPAKEVVNDRVRIGWTSGGHTGESIPSFASGPNADLVNSMHDHVDLANIMFATAGLENPNASPETSVYNEDSDTDGGNDADSDDSGDEEYE